MSNHEPPVVDDTVPQRHIDDRPNHQRADGGPAKEPPVDPDELEEFREFRSWKEAEQERSTPPSVPTSLTIEVEGEDRVYRLCDLDRDVLSHLQILVTFAESDSERAVSLFEALLEPDEFDRLKKDLRPTLRSIKRAHAADPDAPSIEDTWKAMAEAVAAPIRELMADPKRLASLGGQSPTGPSSNTTSTPSALPSMS